MDRWQGLERRVHFQMFRRMPVTLVRGEGTRVWDAEGREYLDFVQGIAVNVLGHAHPVVARALREQAEQLIHTSNLFYTTPQLDLAALLVEHSCLDRVFFCNSGAEAIEGAIKLARRYGRERLDGAYEIIATVNGFHGRTLAAVTATGTEKYRLPFAPLPEGFVHVPYDDVEAIQAATTPRTCAVLLEPVQGEGGVNVPAPDYLRRVREWCNQRGLLLILDEVQTGMGRTGTLWAYQQAGAEPDVMALAKGLGGGVPIGAVLAREHVAAHFYPGDHGSTFGGNPLATRAGYEVLRYVIEQDLPARARELGAYLMQRLRALEDRHPAVREVRGAGLLVAVQLRRDEAEEMARRCLERGLIINNLKPDVLRLTPPLTVSREEIDRAVEILDAALPDGPPK